MQDLLNNPNDFVMSIERYSVSLTSIIGWGRRIGQTNDEVAQLALAVMEAVNYVVPGYFLMEAVPILAKLPSFIYSVPSKIGKGAALFSQYFYLLTQEGAERKVPTFAATLLKAQPELNLSDKEVTSMAANLIGGGVDTTSSTMLSFILAMAYFPEVQKKLQAELDEVVGQDRAPSWEDVDKNLPYLIATVKEVLRWRTVTILAGIPHANTVDYEYRGYHIPAGTNITGNMWAIHRNPRDFPNPDAVRPERFIGKLETPYPNQRGSNPFGWGRRQCSGQPLAEQGLYYSLGMLAWAFNIQPGLDENVRPRPCRPDLLFYDFLLILWC
jgi:cytochrome P450